MSPDPEQDRVAGSARRPREPLALVAALTRARVIGKRGSHRLLWHYSDDMKRFRNATKGHAVIIGRATWDSIGKPLPGRRNIVISRDPALRIEGCDVVSSLEHAIRLAREHDPEPCVLGGAQIYAAALPFATRLILTYVEQEHEGDALFPEIDMHDWIEQERSSAPGLTFVTLVRR
jgi:dihydrofolate reductase